MAEQEKHVAMYNVSMVIIDNPRLTLPSERCETQFWLSSEWHYPILKSPLLICFLVRNSTSVREFEILIKETRVCGW